MPTCRTRRLQARQEDGQVQEVLRPVLQQFLERIQGFGSDEAPQAQAVTALSSWANKVSVRRSIKRDRVKKPRCADKTCINEAELDDYLK